MNEEKIEAPQPESPAPSAEEKLQRLRNYTHTVMVILASVMRRAGMRQVQVGVAELRRIDMRSVVEVDFHPGLAAYQVKLKTRPEAPRIIIPGES